MSTCVKVFSSAHTHNSKMIAISYYNHRDCEGLILNVFSTEDEARAWLISSLVDTCIVDNWYDEDGYYYTPEEIKVAFQKITLKEIIDGIHDGDLQIKMVIA